MHPWPYSRNSFCQYSNFSQGNVENILYVPFPLPSQSSSSVFPSIFPFKMICPRPSLFFQMDKNTWVLTTLFLLRLYRQLCLRPRILRMYLAQSKLSWQLIFPMNSLNFWRRLSLKILSSVTTGREALLKLLERLRVVNRKENKQLKLSSKSSFRFHFSKERKEEIWFLDVYSNNGQSWPQVLC